MRYPLSRVALALPLCWSVVALAQPQPTDPPSDPKSLEQALAAAADADAIAVPPLAAPPSTGREVAPNESNPALSIVADLLGSAYSRANRFAPSGVSPGQTGFALMGVEMAASANIDPYFKFDLAYNLAEGEVEEAYVTTLALPYGLQARAGQFRSRIGRHNRTHPHQWRFALAPVSNQFLFGAEGLGGPGVEVSFLAPLPWYVELITAAQMAEGGSFAAPTSDAKPKDLLYPVRLAQFFDLSDDLALQVGGNAAFGRSALAEGGRVAVYGGDVFCKWRPIGQGSTGQRYLSLGIEGYYRKLDIPGDLWRDLGGFADLLAGLSKRWELGARGEWWRRLSGPDPTEENERSARGENLVRGSAMATFFPSHFSLLRLQYVVERVDGFPTNHAGLLQLQVSAGAHGAHAY